MSPARRVLTAVAVAGCAALLPDAPVGAISSYNSEPAPHRTNVGALVVEWDRDGDGLRDTRNWYCSGTMVDRDTFVTAAHCTTNWPGAVPPRFFVSLAQVIDERALAGAAEGVAHEMPGYPGTSSDSRDLAVVQVTNPRKLPRFTPAALPTAGLLDRLAPKKLSAQPWTVAGYGTEEATREPGGHAHHGGGERRQAPVTFDALNPTWVRLNMTEANGNGGACYGDSGGPNFTVVDGRELLVSTTITGDVPCYSTNVTYRLDAPAAREFLKQFTALP